VLAGGLEVIEVLEIGVGIQRELGFGDGALGSFERRGILIDADHRSGGPDDPGQQRGRVADTPSRSVMTAPLS